jgi:hypothetical protein
MKGFVALQEAFPDIFGYVSSRTCHETGRHVSKRSGRGGD